MLCGLNAQDGAYEVVDLKKGNLQTNELHIKKSIAVVRQNPF